MYFIVRAQNHMQILHIQVMYSPSRPHLPRSQSLVPSVLVITLRHLSYTNAETSVGTTSTPGHGRAVKRSTPKWYLWISGGRIESHKPLPGLPLETASKRAFYAQKAAGYVLTDSCVNRSAQQMCSVYQRWLSASFSFPEPIKLDIMPILRAIYLPQKINWTH